MNKITDICALIVDLTDERSITTTFNIAQAMIWRCEFNAVLSVVFVVRLIWAPFFESSTFEIVLGPHELIFFMYIV